jgi:hypothetical protein
MNLGYQVCKSNLAKFTTVASVTGSTFLRIQPVNKLAIEFALEQIPHRARRKISETLPIVLF